MSTTTITIASLQAELDQVKAQLKPLLSRQETLRRQIEAMQSHEFIRVNGITKANTQLANSPELPHFGRVWNFADWLRGQGRSVRPWAEWNGQIHRSSDLIIGRFNPTPVRYDDLE